MGYPCNLLTLLVKHLIHNTTVLGLACCLYDLRFEFWQGQHIFLISITSKWALAPTQPSSQWLLGFFPKVKGAGV